MKIRNVLLTVAASAVFGTAAANMPVQAQDIANVTAGTAGLPSADVVDISSNNGPLSVSDFQKMRAAGVKGVIVKITEYTTYRNPYAGQQISNAQAAGLNVGVYHYSWYTSPSEAQNEANYFANYASQLGLPKSTLMVDDLEEASTKSGNVSANAAAFNSQLQANGYTNTSIYTYPSYQTSSGLNFSFIGNNRVWMATYPYNPSSASLRNTQYGMWQWSSRASFPGLSGQFDVSIDYQGLMGASSSRNSTTTSTPSTTPSTSSSTGSTDIFGNLFKGLTGSSNNNGQSGLSKIAANGNRFNLSGTYTVNELKLVNGVMEARIDQLSAKPFSWSDNGIPVSILQNANGSSAINAGDQVRFQSAYNHGTIDASDQPSGAVGIIFTSGRGLVWFDANALG
ncbi:GH25 family lysozyme [Leuconostocaceae bacterium ESL0723]|nr:GH25 family lysozyme [Leuconostocaceae bacterium ESL0723]